MLSNPEREGDVKLWLMCQDHYKDMNSVYYSNIEARQQYGQAWGEEKLLKEMMCEEIEIYKIFAKLIREKKYSKQIDRKNKGC